MKPHLFIGTPMFGGMCTGSYTSSMMKIIPLLESKGIKYTFLFRFNESLITRARNAIVTKFMDSGASHLLFIDADIGFDADQVIKMIDADKDIICGIYPSKTINWASVAKAVHDGVPNNKLEKYTGTWVVNMKHYDATATVDVNEPFEIWNGGTGMMLIKRKVFEKLKDKVPSYVGNEVDPIMQSRVGKKIPEFFSTSIDPISGVLLSEDYHFCRIWREAGGTVWAAPWVELSHVGTYIFTGRPTPEDQP